MKNVFVAAVCAALFTTVSPAPSEAGTIEHACNQSDRRASRSLCGCIQDVANVTLQGGEQRRAAGFFRDPHQAQVVRQSDRSTDEQFWKRYKNFYQTAQAYCSS